MHIANILRIIALLMMGYSLSMLPPIAVGLWYQEDSYLIFVAATLFTILLGFMIWFPTRNAHREVRPRDGFLIVTLLWLTLCLISAIPFILYTEASISFIDAMFEAIAGLTTTGATVMLGLESMPRAIVYYRQQLQFIGGGGIILLGIAILPMLGVGGMQLFRADIPGPFKEEKLTPRIAQTAKTLWMLYVGLVVACAFSYWVAGMSVFDAIGHSFSTVSTGGFSTHDQSVAYFQNPGIKWVAIFFMFMGGVNFSLHYLAIRNRNFKGYWQDIEFRDYVWIIFLSALLIAITLWSFKVYNNAESSFTESLFQVVSFSTTTGFSSADYSKWPTYVPTFLTFICLIGGCAGSTSGGIKMIRAILLYKQGVREINRLIHPSGHYVIKFGYSLLHHRTLDAIWGFFGVFVLVFVVLLLLLAATGLDFITASSSLAACLSNTGIGIGTVSDNFQAINDGAKVLLAIAMLAGRLEIFTLLVLLSPSYWRN